jgi:hypothetical protein
MYETGRIQKPTASEAISFLIGAEIAKMPVEGPLSAAKLEPRRARIAPQEGADAEQLVKGTLLRLLAEDTDFRAAVREAIGQADSADLIREREMDAGPGH